MCPRACASGQYEGLFPVLGFFLLGYLMLGPSPLLTCVRTPSCALQEGADGSSGPFEKLNVHLRARLLPRGLTAGARPWLYAGPVRAWSVDFEKKPGEAKATPGLWVCCKSSALFMRVTHASTSSETHAKSWQSGDGLMARGKTP